MKRHTIQRSLVLEAVRRLRSHVTADEVYTLIAGGTPDISRATVYRNLNNLSAEGLIKKLNVPGEADRFDHTCSDHYHIKCEKCGSGSDVDMDYMGDITDNIRDMQGFAITGHDIYFTGVCPSCQRGNSKN